MIEFQLASSSAGLQMGGGEISKNPTLVCAPIMAESVDKMVINMDKAKQGGADLVEIRLDSLKSFNPNEDLKTLIKECPLHTLFTYRFTTGNCFMNKLFLHYVCMCLKNFNFVLEYWFHLLEWMTMIKRYYNLNLLCKLLRVSSMDLSDFIYFSRPKWEGGQYDGDEKKRLDALRLAMEFGADYIDVELHVAF